MAYRMYSLRPNGLRDTPLVALPHNRPWAIVRFARVFFFRLHDDEFRLEPDLESDYEYVAPPDPIYVARDSNLKDVFLAGNSHQAGIGLYPLGLPGIGADALLH